MDDSQKRRGLALIQLRLDPDKNIWDDTIVEWLKDVPRGGRSNMIKYALVTFIKIQARAGLGPSHLDLSEMPVKNPLDAKMKRIGEF
ncbi:MAG TPA: hypothetical protein ENN18_11430 [Proteobacteria bacterium]|nr:hypothetical protein [Pseudomonadota bacterium]